MEKRKFPRIPVTVFSTIEGKEGSHLCHTKNLSKTGMLLETVEQISDEAITPGSTIFLRIPIPLQPDPLEISCQVVRAEIGINQQGQSIVAIALQFKEITKPLQQLIAHYLGDTVNLTAADATAICDFKEIDYQTVIEQLKKLALQRQRLPSQDPFLRIIREQYALLSSHEKTILGKQLTAEDTAEKIDLGCLIIASRLKANTEKQILEQLERLQGGIKADLVTIARNSIGNVINMIEPLVNKKIQELVVSGETDEIQYYKKLKNALDSSLEEYQKFIEQTLSRSQSTSSGQSKESELKILNEHLKDLEAYLGRNKDNLQISPQAKSFLNILSPGERQMFQGQQDVLLDPARLGLALLKKIASEVIFFKTANLEDSEQQLLLRQIFEQNQKDQALINHRLQRLKGQVSEEQLQLSQGIQHKIEKVLQKLAAIYSQLPEKPLTGQPAPTIEVSKYQATEKAKEKKEEQKKKAQKEQKEKKQEGNKGKKKASTAQYVMLTVVVLLICLVLLSQITFVKEIKTDSINSFMPALSMKKAEDVYTVVVDEDKWQQLTKEVKLQKAKQFLDWAQKQQKTAKIKINGLAGKAYIHTLCGGHGCFVAEVPN